MPEISRFQGSFGLIMIWVTKARYISDYKIDVSLSNGLRGTLDLHDLLFADHRPLFQELRALERFKDFRVAMDTIVWGNGADLAPEFICELLGSAGKQRNHA